MFRIHNLRFTILEDADSIHNPGVTPEHAWHICGLFSSYALFLPLLICARTRLLCPACICLPFSPFDAMD